MTKPFILHESFKKAMGRVNYCYLNLGSTLLIRGESGVGKTTVIKESSNQLKSDTTQTILSCRVPLPFNISVFLSTLLRETGAFSYDKGTPEKKKERLIEVIKETGIKLIIIDDFQHIQVRRRTSVEEVMGMLKELLISTGISLVAFAIPDMDIPEYHLGEFFQREYLLKPIPYRSEDEVQSFKSMLNEIEKKLGFEKASEIMAFSNEIYDVTWGNFGRLMTLISGAAFLAKRDNSPNISPLHLGNSSGDMYGAPKINPFNNLIRKGKNDDVKILV